MEKSLNYEQTFKIEVLNEFSNGVYARLLNFILKNGVDKNDSNNFYVSLLQQFSEMLNVDLFKMSNVELDNVKSYWENMNDYIKGITKEKSA
ncbi:hypothetical protein JIN86_08695 [Lysinibacillus sp. HST-98]|uniref:Antitoxin epsilon/PezA domain-containing protein n=1 Tax=Lysinibacillus capsici TaxID=2115968 RepID=A0ABY8KN08_9BACI|nr:MULTISPECIES: hypothetical protein [Lysinibacillus]EFI67497.1 hypothetical protein BFZC1_16654 [Lysinibacillus fusiformis ZC1]MBL3729679.1 hypothetical protein [Lysinibacillus sp. HST-98]MCT1538785.1 hypothetical protein [Lysinibacillus capsici]MCT1569493.1 hypothetical protein [Lysinibacillus capsici]MCT1646508.1 hypothetical protein [Lysinibacillus capsici]